MKDLKKLKNEILGKDGLKNEIKGGEDGLVLAVGGKEVEDNGIIPTNEIRAQNADGGLAAHLQVADGVSHPQNGWEKLKRRFRGITGWRHITTGKERKGTGRWNLWKRFDIKMFTLYSLPQEHFLPLPFMVYRF
jgi:hypothetical protein